MIMPESGWLTSWAMDAVNTPRLVTRATCASSALALFNASSESRRLGHILNRSDVIQMTVVVAGSVSDHMHLFDRTVRQQQPAHEIKVVASVTGSLHLGMESRGIFRMDSRIDRTGM